MKLARLSDPQVSPDGRTVVYAASQVNLAANNSNSDLWVVPLAGGEPRRLTNHPLADSRPRWSPDGKVIGFLSRRGGDTAGLLGGAGRRRATPADQGRERRQQLPLDLTRAGCWSCRTCTPSASGRSRRPRPWCATSRRREEAGKPSTARVYDQLLYRHWDTWEDGKRTHLLVRAHRRQRRDRTSRRADKDVPPFSLAGPDDFAVSPDGKEVVFARNDDPQTGALDQRGPLRGAGGGGPRAQASRTAPATTARLATAPTASRSRSAARRAQATRPTAGA